VVQTLILFFYSVYVLKVDFHGDLWQIILFQILIGILAVCLGIFISAFARNEFQMVSIYPAHHRTAGICLRADFSGESNAGLFTMAGEGSAFNLWSRWHSSINAAGKKPFRYWQGN